MQPIPRKPRTRWLGIMSHFRPMQDEISPWVVRLWEMAVDLDRSPAWRAWWEPAGLPRLELWPGAAKREKSRLTYNGHRVLVESSSPQLDAAWGDLERQMRREGRGEVWPEELPEAFWQGTVDAVYGSLSFVDTTLRLGGLPARLHPQSAARPGP